MKKILLLVLIGFMLSGCDDAKSRVLPTKIEGNEEKLKEIADDLTIEEKKLLVKRIIAHTFSEKFRGEGVIAPGTTVGEAIEAQRKIEESNKLQEAKQDALKQEYLKQKEAMKQQFDDAIDVSLVEKKYYKVRWEDGIRIKIAFKNKTKKKITGVKGNVLFKDIFGDLIKGVRLSNDNEIKAGSTFVYDGSLDFNQFIAEDKKLANTDLEKIKFEFEPEIILFDDGTKLEVKSNANN